MTVLTKSEQDRRRHNADYASKLKERCIEGCGLPLSAQELKNQIDAANGEWPTCPICGKSWRDDSSDL